MKKILMATLVIIMGLGMAANAVAVDQTIQCDGDHGDDHDEDED